MRLGPIGIAVAILTLSFEHDLRVNAFRVC